MEKMKLFIIFGILFQIIFCLDNSLGRTPPMGWNSWNKFGCNINEKIIKNTIDALNSSGLIEAGYKYINIDDCWQGSRSKNGTMVPNGTNFPNGIKSLADYAHSKGLLFGLFSDAGNKTSSGKPGSLGYEDIDAKTYAEWGVDYLKYTNINNNNNPSKERFQVMRDALNKTGRPIFFSLCQSGVENITSWGKDVGNSWRTTGNINSTWESMLGIIDTNNKYNESAGPGGWNDPDILQVGNGGMNLSEYKTHFSLWAISKAPLLIGCDITKMTEEIKEILTNPEVIAINQDSLGEQGRKIERTKVLYQEDNKPILKRSDLFVTDCNGGIEQKWIVRNDGFIKNNDENLCMDIPRCNQSDVVVIIFTCHLENKTRCQQSRNQLWTYSKNAIISQMNTSRCLQVKNRVCRAVCRNTCM